MAVKNTVSSVTLANRIQAAIASALEKEENIASALILVVEKDTGEVIEAHIVPEDEFIGLALNYTNELKRKAGEKA